MKHLLTLKKYAHADSFRKNANLTQHNIPERFIPSASTHKDESRFPTSRLLAPGDYFLLDVVGKRKSREPKVDNVLDLVLNQNQRRGEVSVNRFLDIIDNAFFITFKLFPQIISTYHGYVPFPAAYVCASINNRSDDDHADVMRLVEYF